MLNVNSSQHTVEYLFSQLDQMVGPYPAGVQPTTKRIEGLAFFPGGCGLWTNPPKKPVPINSELPLGKVVVLGHYFDSIKNYQDSCERGYEDIGSPTWKQLKDFLCECHIDFEDCFFTNVYMGLCEKATGTFCGAGDSKFVDRCQAFLQTQIQAQQPKLILTLGAVAPYVLRHLAPKLAEEWKRRLGFSELDKQKKACIYPVQFRDVPHEVAVVALLHSSLRKPNLWRRHYNGEGDAEVALVREGCKACGLVQ